MQVVLAKNSNDPRFLNVDTDVVPFDFKYLHYKIYIAHVSESDPEVAKRKSNKLAKLVQLYGYVIALNLLLPETDEGSLIRYQTCVKKHVTLSNLATLDSLSIPSLDCNQNVDKQHEVIGDRETDSPSLRVSPQPVLAGDGYDQSNSEDSSLSDSDRTLIGDAPGKFFVCKEIVFILNKTKVTLVKKFVYVSILAKLLGDGASAAFRKFKCKFFLLVRTVLQKICEKRSWLHIYMTFFKI